MYTKIYECPELLYEKFKFISIIVVRLSKHKQIKHKQIYTFVNNNIENYQKKKENTKQWRIYSLYFNN